MFPMVNLIKTTLIFPGKLFFMVNVRFPIFDGFLKISQKQYLLSPSMHPNNEIQRPKKPFQIRRSSSHGYSCSNQGFQSKNLTAATKLPKTHNLSEKHRLVLSHSYNAENAFDNTSAFDSRKVRNLQCQIQRHQESWRINARAQYEIRSKWISGDSQCDQWALGQQTFRSHGAKEQRALHKQ